MITDKDRYDRLDGELNSMLNALQDIICEKLDKYGIYYRFFSRVKKSSSILKKINYDSYIENEDKKIQDLIGVRIVLYYQEDIEACKKIFESMFQLPEKNEENLCWEQYESHDNIFSATKTNGVFMLPGFIMEKIKPYIAGLRIDYTFEIQLRTMFFEGWHEVEHDLCYKNKEIWKEFPKESRKLNSVLATLEMCDKYMEALFNDVGHNFYLAREWEWMLRYRYRIKTLSTHIDDELLNLISVDLAKKTFKCSKERIVEMAIKNKINRLDAESIIYLVNESFKETPIYKPEISERFNIINNQKYGKGKRNIQYNIVLNKKENAFFTKVYLDSSKYNYRELIEIASREVYSWLLSVAGNIFAEELSKEIHSFEIAKDDIYIDFKYDIENLLIYVKLSHLGLDEPGKRWTVICRLFKTNKGIKFICRNDMYRPSNANKVLMPYNRPRIYSMIARKTGIVDVNIIYNKIIQLDINEIDDFINLVNDKNRVLPVVVISIKDVADYNDEESVYGKLTGLKLENNKRYYDIIRQIGYISHIYAAYGKASEKLCERLSEEYKMCYESVRIFKRNYNINNKDSYMLFDKETINDYPRDIYPAYTTPPYEYKSVDGAEAVLYEIVKSVRAELYKVEK